MKAPPPGPAREIAQLRALEQRYAELQEEHELPQSHSVLFRSTGERFAFIDAHCTQLRVTWLCHRFGVTPPGFYAWRARGVSDHAKEDRRLTTETVCLFARHHERYGSPRPRRALVDTGWTVSRRRVARLMAAAGLRAKAVRGVRAKVAAHQRYVRHLNLLWKTAVAATNQVWVGEITHLKVARYW